MNAGSCEQVAALVLFKLGLPVAVEIADGDMIIAPSGHHVNEAFVVRFRPAWRSAEATLIPGGFAGTMVREMGEATESGKGLFIGYAGALTRDGVQLSMKINGAVVDAADPLSWSDEWNSFEIVLRKTALVFDLNKDPELMPVADLLVTPLLGMAMALIGTEAIETFEGETEGAAVQYLATRYERKKINRDACLRIHGTTCTGCGFDFGEFYGDLAEGYIEVHHVESLAMTGEVHINPATDLVPLCSNCHSFVHRVSPPLAIEELRRIVAERKHPCSGS